MTVAGPPGAKPRLWRKPLQTRDNLRYDEAAAPAGGLVFAPDPAPILQWPNTARTSPGPNTWAPA